MMYEEERESHEEYIRQYDYLTYMREEDRAEEEALKQYNTDKTKNLISLMGDIINKLMSYKEVFIPWLAEQAPVIQELAAKYPPGTYKFKKKAPYDIVAPGKTVLLISWLKNGDIGVMVKGKDKSKSALENEVLLCERYKKTPEEIKEINDADVTAHVDPKWLIVVSSELA